MDVDFFNSLLTSPSFWVMCAFFTFFGTALYFKGKDLVKGLDARADQIKERIDEAFQIREEAQSLLAHHKQNCDNSAADAHKYILETEEGITHMKETAQNEFLTECARKNKNIAQKVALNEHTAICEVQDALISTSITVATKVITENTTPSLHDTLIQDAIGAIKKTENIL